MSAVLDKPEQIEMFRYKTLLKGLKLETLGMQMSRGRSCYSIIKQEFDHGFLYAHTHRKKGRI